MLGGNLGLLLYGDVSVMIPELHTNSTGFESSQCRFRRLTVEMFADGCRLPDAEVSHAISKDCKDMIRLSTLLNM